MTTFWLKGAGSMNYAAFTPTGKAQVHVLANISWTRTVDSTMRTDKARDVYRELTGSGWVHFEPEDEDTGINLHQLRAMVRD